MEATEEVKKFCEVCRKEKNENECMQIGEKTFCCKECAPDAEGHEKPKKPAICEFC